MICSNCNKKIDENEKFCPHCGEILQKKERGNLLLPPNPITRPLTTWEYIVMLVVGVISPINVILFLIWAFAPYVNLNRKRLARAYLIVWLFVIAIIAVTIFVAINFFNFNILNYVYFL